MRFLPLRLALASFSFLLLLTACSRDTAPIVTEEGKSLTPIVLLTDWYAQPEHGGFYQAVAKGFYEEEGLQVEIRPGANMYTHGQMVATGQVDFSVGAIERLITYRAAGIPLVSLFPYFQHDPQCVLFHEESGIESLQDLDGREVMFQPGLIYADFLQKAMGLDIRLIPMDWSLARYMTDDQFVQQCFLTSEPIQVRRQGGDPKVIPLSESGFDPYRHVYTSEKLIAEKPEVVEAFIRASIKGWADFVSSDPTPAFEAIRASNPQQTMDIMAEIHTEMLKYNLTHGDEAAGETLGQYNKARLRKVFQQMEDMGLIDKSVDLESSFAFDLMPEELVVDYEL